MKIFTLTSSLHAEAIPDASKEAFIIGIEKACGYDFEFMGDDFSSYGSSEDEIIYVRTGGTEGIFRSIFCPDEAPVLPFSGEDLGSRTVRILTSGQSNSLAASMEIISFLNLKGIKGEILHGSAEYIAQRMASPGNGSSVNGIYAVGQGSPIDGLRLDGLRLGVIGRPSDWLISSDVDYALAKKNLGVELMDIDMEELMAEYGRGGYEIPAGIKLAELNECRWGKGIGQEDMERSLTLYGAIRRLIERYGLGGMTIRCFDLLGTLGTTGCMALAILNAEGFIATCEGDIPTMMTMAAARRLYGTPGFQANLSRIDRDKGTLLFAHCTVPLDIVRSYVYDTHFESGIGVAVHGEFETGAVKIMKISPDCTRMFCYEGKLLGNAYGDNLCRTQIIVEAPGSEDYFLSASIGNHHVIVPV